MMSTARLTGQTIGGVVVALSFALTSGGIAHGVTIAMTGAVIFAAAGCVVSFARLGRRA
jgi:hypothetical protein